MNKQEIFNKVVDHLRTQRGRAGHYLTGSVNTFICQFRDSEGRKCAVGCLFLDDAGEDVWMLRGGWLRLKDQHTEVAKLISPDDMDSASVNAFMIHLQKIHDDRLNWYPDEKFNERGEQQLRDFAANYKLDFEEVG